MFKQMTKFEDSASKQQSLKVQEFRTKKNDNTLTLIFDSEDEEQEVVGEGEGENCGGDDGEEDKEEAGSPIFNDVEDSKIDKTFSSGVNRTNNNFVTSNSFQGDASLLFFANNFANQMSSFHGNDPASDLPKNEVTPERMLKH